MPADVFDAHSLAADDPSDGMSALWKQDVAAGAGADDAVKRRLHALSVFDVEGKVQVSKADIVAHVDERQAMAYVCGSKEGGDTRGAVASFALADSQVSLLHVKARVPCVGVLDGARLYLFPSEPIDGADATTLASDALRMARDAGAAPYDVGATLYSLAPPKALRARTTSSLSPAAAADARRRDAALGVDPEEDPSGCFARYSALMLAVELARVLCTARLRHEDAPLLFAAIAARLMRRAADDHERLQLARGVLRAFALGVVSRTRSAAAPPLPIPRVRVDVGMPRPHAVEYRPTTIADPRRWKEVQTLPAGSIELDAPHLRRKLLSGAQESLASAWRSDGAPLVTNRHYVASSMPRRLFAPRKNLSDFDELYVADEDALIADALFTCLNASIDVEKDHCRTLPDWTRWYSMVDYPYVHAQHALDEANGTVWLADDAASSKGVPLVHEGLSKLLGDRLRAQSDAGARRSEPVTLEASEREAMQLGRLSTKHRVRTPDGVALRPADPVFPLVRSMRVVAAPHFESFRDLHLAPLFGDDVAVGWVRMESDGVAVACERDTHVTVHADAESALASRPSSAADIDRVALGHVSVLGRRDLTHRVHYPTVGGEGRALRAALLVYHPVFVVVDAVFTFSTSSAPQPVPSAQVVDSDTKGDGVKAGDSPPTTAKPRRFLPTWMRRRAPSPVPFPSSP